MPAPIVPNLPVSPSRLSRPSNFVTESTIFLEALTAFRTNVNLLNTYINSQIPNKYNFGNIGGIRNFPNISQTTEYDIEYTGDGIDFTSDLDIFYDLLNKYSYSISNASTWYDSVLNEVGTIPYDLDKPMISGISLPMNRSESRDNFNDTALLFGQTSVDNINSLYESIYYTYITSCSNQNFGSITDTTIIKTIDGGSITDTNLTY